MTMKPIEHAAVVERTDGGFKVSIDLGGLGNLGVTDPDAGVHRPLTQVETARIARAAKEYLDNLAQKRWYVFRTDKNDVLRAGLDLPRKTSDAPSKQHLKDAPADFQEAVDWVREKYLTQYRSAAKLTSDHYVLIGDFSIFSIVRA